MVREEIMTLDFETSEKFPGSILERDPKNRFSLEETRSLGRVARQAWESRLRQNKEAKLVDKKVVFGPELASSFSTLPYYPTRYPDGEPGLLVAAGDEVMAEQVALITSQTDINNLIELQAIVLDMRYEGVKNITLIAAYLPCGRGDRPSIRRQDWREVALLETVMANVATVADGLIILDAHSPATTWFGLKYDLPVLDISSRSLLIKQARSDGLLNGSYKVVVPDSGGYGSGAVLAKEMGVGLIRGMKDKSSGETKVSFPEKLAEQVRGTGVVVIEDMIATGGTILQSAEQLLEAGAEKIVILTTHAIFAGDALVNLVNVPQVYIYTTDSRKPLVDIRGAKNITTVPVLDKLARLADMDLAGVSPWSKEGKDYMQELGLDLAPWLVC